MHVQCVRVGEIWLPSSQAIAQQQKAMQNKGVSRRSHSLDDVYKPQEGCPIVRGDEKCPQVKVVDQQRVLAGSGKARAVNAWNIDHQGQLCRVDGAVPVCHKGAVEARRATCKAQILFGRKPF